MSEAPRTSKLIAAGPAGDLEVLLDEPANATSVDHVAVVCHPHPPSGGSMTNKVTHILARTFCDLGTPAVRFNFRGVGKSHGTHDDGRGEVEDTLAIMRWTTLRWPNAKLQLAGFSFGAAMALLASLRHPVDKLITVAPALHWLTPLHDHGPNCPWLIVQGDRDELVDAQAVRQWTDSLSQPPTLKILTGAEHFFHGRLNDLRDVVKTWLLEA